MKKREKPDPRIVAINKERQEYWEKEKKKGRKMPELMLLNPYYRLGEP